MISLVFGTYLLQLRPATPQPKCQEFRFCRQPWYLFSADLVRRIAAVLAGRLHKLPVIRATLFALNDDPLSVPISNAFIQDLSHPKLSLDSSPDRFTRNSAQCLVCDVQSFASCTVCDQEFCSTHLYLCADCDSQYCGNCLDDHRAHGHWTDSDTAAELSHAQCLLGMQAGCRDGAISISARKFSSIPWLQARVIELLSLVSMVFFACGYLCSLSAVSHFPQCILLMEVSL